MSPTADGKKQFVRGPNQVLEDRVPPPRSEDDGLGQTSRSRSDAKKAQQRLLFLRQLKRFNLPKTMMVHFYTAIMESILCSPITVWYAAATAKDEGRLQRVLRSAERLIGCNLPSLQDLFASRSLKQLQRW